MGAVFYLRAGWPQWKPLDVPGTHQAPVQVHTSRLATLVFHLDADPIAEDYLSLDMHCLET